ncbi:hypothetical protein BH24ACT14_BH24ACT14_12050 [soil metagenome]
MPEVAAAGPVPPEPRPGGYKAARRELDALLLLPADDPLSAEDPAPADDDG